MKKLLIASTALVATSTLAMAEVSIEGSAEMGVFGGEGVGGQDVDLQFHTDIDATFVYTGESDTGLLFGAEFELDDVVEDSPAAFDNNTQGGEVIFISGGFGTITMGDTDGAVDRVLTEAIIGGSIIDDNEHLGYNGNNQLDGVYDGQIVRYDYSFGDFAVALSAELDDDGDGDPVYGIGASYSGDFNGFGFSAGLGYQAVGNDGDDNEPESIGLSLGGTFGGFEAILNYTSYDDLFQAEVGDFDFSVDEEGLADDLLIDAGFTGGETFELDNHYGIALGYSFDQFLVAVNYGKFEFDGAEVDGYSLVANYDLGGGAEIQFGASRSDIDFDGVDIDGEVDTYSLGISMSF